MTNFPMMASSVWADLDGGGNPYNPNKANIRAWAEAMQNAAGKGGMFISRADAEAALVNVVTTHISVAGLLEPGDGGGGVFKRVGSDPGHGASFSSGDGAFWELVHNGHVSIKQFGAVGDGITDDWAAINDALHFKTDYQQQSGYGVVVHIPPTEEFYYIGQTIDLQNTVHVRGSGYRAGSVGQLVFAPDTMGIVVNASDTTMDTTRVAGDGATWSKFEDLEIVGQSSGGMNSAYPGIRLRTKAYFSNVSVYGFPGDGFNIVANAGAGGATEGNTNYSQFENCKAWWNGRHGVFMDGPDANAMTFVNLDVQSNGRFGFFDSSFLGNFVFGFHTANNGKPNRGYNTAAQSNLTSHGGNRYGAAYNATETQLRTTTPGTNEAVWYFIEVGGTGTNYLAWTGQPVGTFHAGGPFATEDVNARSVMVGYAEGGQGKGHLSQRATLWGGIQGDGTYGDGSRWTGEEFQGDMDFVNRTKINQREVTLGLRGRNDIFFRAVADGDDPNGLRFGWDETNDLYEFRHGTSDPLLTFGNDIIGSLFLGAPKGVRVGTGQITIGSVDGFGNLPASPRRGDVYFNSLPSAGEQFCWVCLSATGPVWGTVGTITQV